VPEAKTALVGFTGDIELLAELAKELPFAFVAITVKVYGVPFVRPVTDKGEDSPDAVKFPGSDVTVYPVIADPPVAPAVNATDTCVSPAVTESIVGACGTVVAVTPDEAVDEELVPNLLAAMTVYVYCVED